MPAAVAWCLAPRVREGGAGCSDRVKFADGVRCAEAFLWNKNRTKSHVATSSSLNMSSPSPPSLLRCRAKISCSNTKRSADPRLRRSSSSSLPSSGAAALGSLCAGISPTPPVPGIGSREGKTRTHSLTDSARASSRTISASVRRTSCVQSTRFGAVGGTGCCVSQNSSMSASRARSTSGIDGLADSVRSSFPGNKIFNAPFASRSQNSGMNPFVFLSLIHISEPTRPY